MMRPLRLVAFVVFAAGCGSAPSEPAAAPETVDLAPYFEGMDGTFVTLDLETGRRRVYNPDRAATRFIPASTFKIPNTLIALETGIASGPEFAIAWDSTVAPPQSWWPRAWRQDQTLRTAFRNSVFWAYQSLARRTGEATMQDFVDRFDYGNRDLGGGIDQFWLNGDLRISSDEQIDFLGRLVDGDLGVSARSTQIVRDLMLLEETPSYRLYGKTGTAELTPTRELGWLVGFVETEADTTLYALNMEGERVWEDWPPQTRADLVRQLLVALDVIPTTTL